MARLPFVSFQTPYFRVFPEGGAHILMHELLEILPESLTQCSDSHIGANATFARDIASRVVERYIGRIVCHGDTDLWTTQRTPNLIQVCSSRAGRRWIQTLWTNPSRNMQITTNVPE